MEFGQKGHSVNKLIHSNGIRSKGSFGQMQFNQKVIRSNGIRAKGSLAQNAFGQIKFSQTAHSVTFLQKILFHRSTWETSEKLLINRSTDNFHQNSPHLQSDVFWF